MIKMLARAEQNKDTIKMYYIDQRGHITERYVRVLKISGDYVIAYCFWRRKIRTFKIENILAASKNVSAS